MAADNDREKYLDALRCRLQLESGLGIEYLPAKPIDWDATLNPKIPEAPKGDFIRPALSSPRDLPAREEGRAAPDAGPSPSAPRASGRPTMVPLQEAPPSPEREALLQPLREQSAACRLCGLCERRTTVVWGEGSLDAAVMFIGEGPGRDEDEQGRPFVGPSGRLLTDIIEKGMKLPRPMVYITNVVKCRPPGNRDPKPDEVAACNIYLSKQIEVIAPKVVVAVGGVAGCALLGLPPRSPGLRGKWHEHDGKPMRVIYHPSYLLRQRRASGDRTDADRETWSDIMEIMKMMGG